MNHRLLWTLPLATLTACLAPTEDPMHDDPFSQDIRDPYLIHDDELSPRARGAKKAPPGRTVYPVEPKSGPWTGNNQLGITQDFLPDANNRQTILKMDEWGQVSMRTVMLGLTFNEDAVLPTSNLAVKGVVEIGAGGSTQTAIVDWKNGVQLSAPMNAVNVIAQYDEAVDLDNIDLRLSAFIGQYPFGGVRPTYTHGLVTAASGGFSTAVRIPAFAGELIIYPEQDAIFAEDPYGSAVEYRFLDINQIPTGPVLNIAGDVVRDFQGVIKVPNNAYYVIIANSGAATVAARFIFNLDL